MAKILVVDDEPELRDQLAWAAQGDGREVIKAESGKQAVRLIQQDNIDVIVTDLRMETDEAGLDVLRAAKRKDIYIQVIVITAHGKLEISIQTMRLGAFDFLERNAPGIDTLAMVRSKITLALEFRRAKVDHLK